MAGLVPAIHALLNRLEDMTEEDAARGQSTLIFAPFTTAPQRSRSFTRKAEKSSADPTCGSTPSFANAAWISDDVSASLIALLSFVTIAAGVPVGATMPVNDTDTKS